MRNGRASSDRRHARSPAPAAGSYTGLVEALRRIVHLITRPRTEWDTIAREPTSVDALIRRYIVPLSMLAPLATSIGMRVFDAQWDPAQGYLVPADQIFAAGATTLFTSIVSIFALAGIFVTIAPMYGSSRNYGAALTVATYGAVPVLVAGITLVLPAMAVVELFALCHSLFLYWLGVRRVLNVPGGAQAEFVGISITLLAALSTLAGAAASSIGLF